MCINPDHLFLGTNKDNTADMIKKGRQRKSEQTLRGERHGSSKLNEEIVRTIRASTGTAKSIGQSLGVPSSTVEKVRARHTWRHVI
jgi:hypothetical protein